MTLSQCREGSGRYPHSAQLQAGRLLPPLSPALPVVLNKQPLFWGQCMTPGIGRCSRLAPWSLQETFAQERALGTYLPPLTAPVNLGLQR